VAAIEIALNLGLKCVPTGESIAVFGATIGSDFPVAKFVE